MKDLTHYFVSPPKSSEKIDDNERNTSSVLNRVKNPDEITISKERINDVKTIENNPNNINNNIKKDNNINESKSKKRSRVKIRISLKETKKNSRCDIIENSNDVVDKTPSPFNKKVSKITTKNNSDDGIKYDDKKKIMTTKLLPPRESEKELETCREASASSVANVIKIANSTPSPNAFQLLMTRNKPSIIIGQKDESKIKSKDKNDDKIRKIDDKVVDPVDPKKNYYEKGFYFKRKHSEIIVDNDNEDEDETIEKNRREKRAKLLINGRNCSEIKEKNDNDDGKNKKKDRGTRKNKKQKNKKKNSGGDCNKGNENNNEGRRNNDGESGSGKNSGKINIDDEEAVAVAVAVLKTENTGREETPKSKTRWTMRVKLQSNSDDDDDKAKTSEDDYIFTPKSKVKYRKKKRSSSDRESKEGKTKPELIEIDKPGGKNLQISNSNSHSYSKSGKHRAKKTSEINPNEESKSSTQRVADISVEIIEDNSTGIEDDCPKILQERKLAPLFAKRSKPNPAAIEARRSFLQSGIPETVRKFIAEQKPSPTDTGTSTMPFPTISHVSQSEIEISGTNSETEALYKQKADPSQSMASLSLSPSGFKSVSDLRGGIQREIRKNDGENFSRIEREDFESVLKDVESRCSEARAMWESVSSAVSNRAERKSPPKKRSKKLKLQRKSDGLEPAEENSDGLNPTWISKYKPISTVQVVGNESAVSKLRNWLSGWRLPSFKDDQSSGDEFYSSDCSSSSSYENNQVAVLLGPHGSGKTASVYAIAEELGYRVLEVNASSRRTGKKLLSDFQEATKSHRVKRDQRTLIPAKKKPSDKKVPQNSLILIEDVDLIFEEDEGFVSATFQLAANTRRPIVMTCKESCAHLNRMAPRQQLIHFQTVSGNRVSALLELIALAESGYRLTRSCLDILLRNGDLRQSLLQLQYILLSGPPSVSQLGESPASTLWVDMQSRIYKPAIKSSKKNRREKLVGEEERRLIETLAKKLDNVSLVSSLTEVENPASPPWRGKLNPSLSLLEDFKPYSKSLELGGEIADWLRIASLESSSSNINGETNFQSKSQLAIKRKVKVGIDLALSQAIPSSLERKCKAIDYLPVIRTICRAEEDRASINTKRGKRFYNYLNGLNLVSASSNILSAASSVFKDKSL